MDLQNLLVSTRNNIEMSYVLNTRSWCKDVFLVDDDTSAQPLAVTLWLLVVLRKLQVYLDKIFSSNAGHVLFYFHQKDKMTFRLCYKLDWQWLIMKTLIFNNHICFWNYPVCRLNYIKSDSKCVPLSLVQ